ncbi:hypothetical protein [Streptomyces sp. NPDC003327]
MRMKLTPTITAVGLLLVLTACGSAENPPATASHKDSAEAATDRPSPPAQTSTAAPVSTTAAPLTFGSTHAWEDAEAAVSGTSAVLGYQQGITSVGSAAEESGNKNYVWAALELKVCSNKGVFVATTTPWTLSYADGSRIEPSSSTWDDFPKPEFPLETKLTPGKCVRGKVVFPVPGDSRPETVVYSPESMDVPVEWAVPAK